MLIYDQMRKEEEYKNEQYRRIQYFRKIKIIAVTKEISDYKKKSVLDPYHLRYNHLQEIGSNSQTTDYTKLINTNNSLDVRLIIESYYPVYDRKVGLCRSKIGKYNIFEVEYGYYPQMAAPKQFQSILEEEYKNNNLVQTQINYELPKSFKNKLKISNLNAYLYNQKLYVRVPICCNIVLSNEEQYYPGNSVWIEVQPIKWFITDMFSKKIFMTSDKKIFGGIEYKIPINLDQIDDELSSFDKEIQERIYYEKYSELHDFITNHFYIDMLKIKKLKFEEVINNSNKEKNISNNLQEKKFVSKKLTKIINRR